MSYEHCIKVTFLASLILLWLCKTLALGEARGRVGINSLYSFGNFCVNLKLVHKTKLKMFNGEQGAAAAAAMIH